MKYYRIKIQAIYGDKITSSAEGKNVTEKDFFYRIGEGEIIENTPVFDYFILKSFDEEKYWEWALFDIHDFIGVGSIITGWYISDKLKTLLEKFKIAPKYHFYETRLLYKGEKFKYWIFQFPIEPYKNIDFQKSFFYLPDDKKKYSFLSENDFVSSYRILFRESKKKLKANKLVLKSYYDILYSTNNEIIVSEALKQSIEDNNITGFEFSELDYEVVVG